LKKVDSGTDFIIWIGSAVIFIAITVGLAAYFGQPVPLEVKVPPSITEGGAREDLDFERIRTYIERFSSAQSRMTGYQGCEDALALIQQELERIGLTDNEVQEFPVSSPIVKKAVLQAETDRGIVTVPLHPLWPNLARTCQTGPDGISGLLADAGRGDDDDLEGKVIKDRIVLMDWDSRSEWLNVPEFGGKVTIFRANDLGDGFTAREKLLTIPADFPRFYVTKEFFAVLDYLLTNETEVTIHCDMEWERVTARNLLVRASGPEDNSEVTDRDKQSLVFNAYYDSISIVPDLSPGAEQSSGAATLLELAHFLSGKEFDRPIYLLFTGGHGQSLSGMTHFVRTLKDGLESDWEEADKDSLIVRMGRPCLFSTFDLSSRSERIGVFCVGRYRGENEGVLRPKFSALGLKLDEYAKSFQTVEGATEGLSPFVDCINLTLGRGWWTYFPYQAPFESELPTMARFPGITLSTINDDRRYVDSPDDTIDHMRFDLFERQILAKEGERVGLANLALALASWSGPFSNADLPDVWARLSGRVVWLDQKKNYIRRPYTRPRRHDGADGQGYPSEHDAPV